MINKKIKLSNVILSYWIKKSIKPKLTVIFIHGFPFDKTMWRSQMENLPDDIQGIAVDVRGHGKSTAGHGYFSIDLFARDLLAFIELLSLSNVVLCGISMGGYIVLRARELSKILFSGLILVATHPFSDNNQAKQKRFETITALLTHGKRIFSVNFTKNVFSEKGLSESPEMVTLIKNSIQKNDVRGMCATSLALAARTDTSERLHEITVPCLIIGGEEDKLVKMEDLTFLHHEIKNSKLLMFTPSGHLPNLEQQSRFNQEINQFLIGI